MTRLVAMAFALSLTASVAAAQTCGTLPYQLTNDQVADATQVMANFDALVACINNSGISTIVGGGVASSASTIALPTIPVVARPALSSLTWVNRAQATATDNTNGPLVLRTTQDTGGNGINALVKSVAGSSWTVTIEYALGNHVGGTNLDMPGLAVQNSATGQMYVCGIVGSNSISVWAYSSPTAYSSSPGSKTINVTYNTIWTRAQYVSSTTTLTFSYSIDGFTWETIYSTSSPYVGVPTGYGVAVGTQGNSSGYVLSLNYMMDSSP